MGPKPITDKSVIKSKPVIAKFDHLSAQSSSPKVSFDLVGSSSTKVSKKTAKITTTSKTSSKNDNSDDIQSECGGPVTFMHATSKDTSVLMRMTTNPTDTGTSDSEDDNAFTDTRRGLIHTKRANFGGGWGRNEEEDEAEEENNISADTNLKRSNSTSHNYDRNNNNSSININNNSRGNSASSVNVTSSSKEPLRPAVSTGRQAQAKNYTFMENRCLIDEVQVEDAAQASSCTSVVRRP